MTGQFRVLETVFRRAGLGLRAIDVALGTPVGAGYRGWAQALDSDSAPVPGRVTSAGVHAFAGLPGLGAWEHPPIEPGAPESIPEPSTPVAPIDFAAVLEPVDGGFLKLGLSVTVPVEGAVDTLAFSGPSRPVPAGFTAVRGDLRVGAADGPPARWALIELRPAGAPPDGEVHLGLSDGSGAFCVLLPTPSPFSNGNGGSGTPLHERTVAFELAVAHTPGAQRFLVRRPDGRTTLEVGAVDGATVGALPAGHRSFPDVDSLVAQSAASLIDPAGGAPISALPLALPFRSEAVAKTHDDPPFVLLHA